MLCVAGGTGLAPILSILRGAWSPQGMHEPRPPLLRRALAARSSTGMDMARLQLKQATTQRLTVHVVVDVRR